VKAPGGLESSLLHMQMKTRRTFLPRAPVGLSKQGIWFASMSVVNGSIIRAISAGRSRSGALRAFGERLPPTKESHHTSRLRVCSLSVTTLRGTFPAVGSSRQERFAADGGLILVLRHL
jgi:hypothetical protein